MDQVFVWTVNEVIGIVIVACLAIAYTLEAIRVTYKQKRCKHDGHVYETMGCDAICGKCAKNLGFIQNWRNKQHE